MKILLNGICGRMGREVEKLILSGYHGAVLVGGVDLNCTEASVPVFHDFDSVNVDFDCIIDFSFHTSAEALCEFAKKANKPIVIATTGHTDEEKKIIEDTSKIVPVFYSANMSLGIALLAELARIAVKTFPDADIEIVEKHHNRKADAPSGTALMLANVIKKVREKSVFVLGRNGQGKRQKDEIGIHAIRMGNIVGEHEIIIGTDTQTITLKHEAASRSLFAEGAVAAAEFTVGCKPGLYDMNSLIAVQN
jgi:4-hydroxy-tetrahydrodipicolinate reductase